MEESRILPDKTEFQYVQAVLFKQECIDCHYEAHAYRTLPNGKYVEIKAGDLAVRRGDPPADGADEPAKSTRTGRS